MMKAHRTFYVFVAALLVCSCGSDTQSKDIDSNYISNGEANGETVTGISGIIEGEPLDYVMEEEESSCTKFYIYNVSSYSITVEYDGWGNEQEKFDGIITPGEEVMIESACAFGPFSYPSEVFTTFEIYLVVNGEESIAYTDIDNSVWQLDTTEVDRYNSQTLHFIDQYIQ